MKRTVLQRKSPLLRKTWMKRSTKRSSYARRPRDLDFMRWVRSQPCLLAFEHECDGPVEADHAGDIGIRALGRKADDKTCLPLCTKAHMERQRWRGYFQSLGVIGMREWTEKMSAMLWDRYYRETGCRLEP